MSHFLDLLCYVYHLSTVKVVEFRWNLVDSMSRKVWFNLRVLTKRSILLRQAAALPFLLRFRNLELVSIKILVFFLLFQIHLLNNSFFHPIRLRKEKKRLIDFSLIFFARTIDQYTLENYS